MKRSTRVLSLLMCLVMIFSLMPFSAAAADTTTAKTTTAAKATAAPKQVGPFTDVSSTAWYADSVKYVYDNKLMNGTSDKTFEPQTTTTRAMVVTILHRQAGTPAPTAKNKFKDVPAGKWYTEAIVWAAEKGVVSGYSAEKFGPSDAITREQMATILCRYAKMLGTDTSAKANLKDFKDAGTVSSWAKDAIQWAVASGLMQGMSKDTLGPKGNTTRAQVATLLMRFIENIVDAFVDTDGDKLSDDDEKLIGTDPKKPDTDGDGFTDYEEVMLETDPLKKNDYDAKLDSDEDGLTDVDEVQKYGSSPFAADTDADGLSDYDEVKTYKTDPAKEDTDGDGLSDGFEVANKLDPTKESTDGKTKDSEVKIQQEIAEDAVSQQLLDEDNVAVPSVSGTKAGEMADHVYLASSGDAAIEENRSVVGEVVSVEGEDSYVKGLTLSFNLDSFAGNKNNLTIATVNEDGQFEMVPSKLKENVLTGTVSESGSYCVVDMNEFLSSLGIDLSKYLEKEDASALSVPQVNVNAPNHSNNVADSGAVVLSEKDMEADINRLNETNAHVLADKVSGQADIVFAIDTTGSMSGTIYNVITNVSSFVETLANNYNVQVNFALIDFKDLEEDGPGTTVVVKNGSSNWYSNVNTFTSQVSTLYADGGGDDPECAIDALETARRLDFRPTANKFVILITDIYYKNANDYGVASMEEEIELLKKDGIITSVVTDPNYVDEYYADLYKSTGGIFTDIYGDFSSALLSLADLIGETTSDGEWVILKHGYRYVKLLDEPDQDGDGLTTEYELGKAETVNLTPFINAVLIGAGVPIKEYAGKTEITVYNAVSDPTTVDTDGDGILDVKDDAPWVKGYADKTIGELTMLAVAGDKALSVAAEYALLGGANTGHSFLIYKSYVNDDLDLSGWNGGYLDNGGSWVDATAQTTPSKHFKLTPNYHFAFSAGGNDDFSASCAIYNMEFFKHMNPPNYSYQPNEYITKKITQVELDKILNTMNSEAGYEYKAVSHNCTHVTLNVWNDAFGTDINPIGINTPRNLYTWLSKHDGTSNFDLDKIIH